MFRQLFVATIRSTQRIQRGSKLLLLLVVVDFIIITIIINCKCVYIRWQCATMQDWTT